MNMRQGLSEKGVASLMVTTVLILVIGLIVVGFSQVTRRNQRETLDRQLSTQAFYAAETAVNGVKAYLDARPSGVITEKSSCVTAGSPYKQDFDFAAANARVTCLLVDGSLNQMFYPTVTDADSTIAPVISSNGTAITSIRLTWTNKDTPSPTTLGACNGNSLPVAGAGWTCAHGVLRTDIVNGAAGSIATASSSPAVTAFFRPNTSAASGTFSGTGLGGLYGVRDCTLARCVVTIAGLNASTYYLRMASIYKDSSVTIEAFNGATQLELSGQVLVDATGNAGSILRRIQVRLPIEAQSNSNLPINAIESTASICKRYITAPGSPGIFIESLPVITPAATCN